MASTTHKRLALAVIDFLAASLKDGTVPAGDRESIDVAQQCIQDCFDVDMNDKAAMADALGGKSLVDIYGVYEKLIGKTAAGAASSGTSAKAAPKSNAPLSPEQKTQSEQFKAQGNVSMQQKDYNGALEFYSKAIEIDSTNPIFLSNRAAAYSALNKHEEAAIDAEAAVASDPNFTKAWSRLGLARFALGDPVGSMEAYKKGIDREGNGGSPAMKKGYETAKRKAEEEEAAGSMDDDVGSVPRGPGAGAGAGGMPDLAGLASMLGGGGGGGGGGGPDLSSLLNNPMLASMAQNLMSNPEMMNNIMSNPQLRQMADRFQGGGGGAGAGAGGAGAAGGSSPDISSLLQDPSIAEM
ncbi:MAG: hypothetical protein M1814_004358 [Vezdaea aestivalis]|nr:MAG: hypothetical protein M1814_004358 [Vezdaea aestivalis]